MVRIKHRYLLANILYPNSITTHSTPQLLTLHQPLPSSLTSYDLLRLIRSKIQEMYGDYGSGAVASSLAIKYFSPATSTFILRVARRHYRIAWGALTFMDSVGWDGGKERRQERKGVVRVVRVSGTMKKAEEEAIRRAREMILRGRREAGEQAGVLEEILRGGGEEERAKKRDLLVVDESDGEDDEMSDG